MFLNQLSFQEKKMFLDLSIHAAKVNNEFSAEEKMLISSYCVEMQISAIELYETEPIETVTDYFALADDTVKRIVVLEILGLLYSDGSYDELERNFVDKFISDIGVDNDTYVSIQSAIEDYYKACANLAASIE